MGARVGGGLAHAVDGRRSLAGSVRGSERGGPRRADLCAACEPDHGGSRAGKAASSVGASRGAKRAVLRVTSSAKALRIRKEYNLTDLGNSERFIEQHGKDLRYVPDWRKWLVWDCRWNLDETRAVNRLASETARSIWREIPNAETVGERADVANHARRSESERAVRAMVTLAENDKTIVVRPSELDREPWLLQCENGVLDLRTSEFRPAYREDLLTKACGVAYDPEATAPTWDAFP